MIVFEYSLWLVPICLLPGAFWAWLLYFSKRSKNNVAKWQRNLLASLRFISISILCLLLLSPFIQINNPTLQKPIIVLAQDASESITLNKDSAFYRNQFIARFDSLAQRLSDDYEVVSYNFGQNIKTGFDTQYSQSLTNFSSLFSYLQQSYFGRNLGALIVASDGIANSGDSPYFAAQQSEANYPVYTIALGDTIPAQDVILQHIQYNKITFQGANYPIELSVSAEGFKGKTIEIRIVDQANTIVQSQKTTINTQHSFQKIELSLLAKKEGLYHYKIEIIPLDGELSTKNNYKDIAFEVFKSKQKILIVYSAPHPDVVALAKALKTNQNYSVTTSSIQDFKEQLSDYNLVFLYQLPSAQQPATALLSQLNQNATPCIIVLGSGSDMQKFNALGRGLQITANRSSDEVIADYRSDFDLFAIDQDMQLFLQNSPPLSAPYGDYRIDGNTRILASQRVGSTTTNRPLIMFWANGEQKTALLAAEGWWRWRVYNHLRSQNTEQFDAFVNKIATYMAVKDKKSRFSLQNDAIYPQNMPITFTAERYNESYELSNDAELSCTITNQYNKTTKYQFSKTSHSYALTLGYLPVGDYTFAAQTTIDKKIQEVKGHFSVIAVQAEVENTQANHAALSNLSKGTNAAMFSPNQMQELEQAIRKNNDIVTISYENKSMIELIRTLSVFVVFLILFGLEWFLRKYWGQF